jgi:hypothetical protein
MPLVGFRPTKARLIIEDSRAPVLVMKVVVYKGDTIRLAAGDLLEDLTGVLRIRERKENGARNGGVDPGTLVYIAESGYGADLAPAKYQINIAMSPPKFDTLVRLAMSGRLPAKFFVEAGERISRTESRGLKYEMRGGKRIKFWDTAAHRTLLVTNFSFILPIDVAEPRGEEIQAYETDPGPSVATNAQVAELLDNLLVFHGETKNTLFALMGILGVLAFAALIIGLALFQRA